MVSITRKFLTRSSSLWLFQTSPQTRTLQARTHNGATNLLDNNNNKKINQIQYWQTLSNDSFAKTTTKDGEKQTWYYLISRYGGSSFPVGRVLSSWSEGPGSRLLWQKLSCTLMAPGACKIRHGCNVFQVSIYIIPLGVPKRQSLRGRSKLQRHVSGSSFGMNPRLSAIAH